MMEEDQTSATTATTSTLLSRRDEIKLKLAQKKKEEEGNFTFQPAIVPMIVSKNDAAPSAAKDGTAHFDKIYQDALIRHYTKPGSSISSINTNSTRASKGTGTAAAKTRTSLTPTTRGRSTAVKSTAPIPVASTRTTMLRSNSNTRSSTGTATMGRPRTSPSPSSRAPTRSASASSTRPTTTSSTRPTTTSSSTRPSPVVTSRAARTGTDWSPSSSSAFKSPSAAFASVSPKSISSASSPQSAGSSTRSVSATRLSTTSTTASFSTRASSSSQHTHGRKIQPTPTTSSTLRSQRITSATAARPTASQVSASVRSSSTSRSTFGSGWSEKPGSGSDRRAGSATKDLTASSSSSKRDHPSTKTIVFNESRYKVMIGQEMEKIKSRQAQKKKSEEDLLRSSCSFRPVLATARSRSSSAQGKRDSADKIHRLASDSNDSIDTTNSKPKHESNNSTNTSKKAAGTPTPFHETLSTTHRGNVVKMQQLESDIAAVYTFKPKIPLSSERIVGGRQQSVSADSHDGRGSISKFERLYQEGLRHKLQAEKERKALQRDQLDMECPFTPNINPKSHLISRSTSRAAVPGEKGGMGLDAPSKESSSALSLDGLKVRVGTEVDMPSESVGSSHMSEKVATGGASTANSVYDGVMAPPVSIFERLSSTPTAAFVMKDPRLDPALSAVEKDERYSHNHTVPNSVTNTIPDSTKDASSSSSSNSSSASSIVATGESVGGKGDASTTARNLQEMLLSVKEELEMGPCTFVPRLTTTGPVIAYQNKNVFSRLSEPS